MTDTTRAHGISFEPLDEGAELLATAEALGTYAVCTERSDGLTQVEFTANRTAALALSIERMKEMQSGAVLSVALWPRR